MEVVGRFLRVFCTGVFFVVFWSSTIIMSLSKNNALCVTMIRSSKNKDTAKRKLRGNLILGANGKDEGGNVDRKKRQENYLSKFLIKIGRAFAAAAVAVLLFVQIQHTGKLLLGGEGKSYELFPYMVSPEKVSRSVSKTTGIIDPQDFVEVDLPSFPVIQELESCRINHSNKKPLRDPSNWRKRFVIGSFPASGAANIKADSGMIGEIIDGLFRGEDSGNFVKSTEIRGEGYCASINETIACSTLYPVMPNVSVFALASENEGLFH